MSVVEDIKARLDIVQLVQSYGVQLRKAGRNYTAPCPFHQERTPSFVVFPETGGWHCFGACGIGGDVFSFVMRRENLDFAGALEMLADRAGVTLARRTPAEAEKEAHLDRLRGLLAAAADHFHKKLLKHADTLAYVQKRGLNEATLKTFSIGYAADDWDDTLTMLRRHGYSMEEIIDSGMAIHGESDRVYDRFRNRLMIPICDEKGRPIGFGARALRKEDNPKYLNSPQTALFDKSATLFGLHLARRSIRESETAVIVEGYMDAIQAHQNGFTNVVAQMGTALTKVQLRALSRYARRLVLALDSDAAGAKATMRGLDVVRQASEAGQVFFDPAGMLRQASKLDVELNVVTLPEGKDPDDLIREDPAAWQALVAKAQPVADYVIAVGTAGIAPSASFAEREQVARELLPILMATENDLQRNANIQQLAYKLRLGSGRTLVEWAGRQVQAPRVTAEIPAPPDASKVQSSSVAGAEPPRVAPAKPKDPNGVAIEHYCLASLLQVPSFLSVARRKLRELAAKHERVRDALGPLTVEDFTLPAHRAIFDTFVRACDQDDQDVLDYLEARLPLELYGLADGLRREQLQAFQERLTGVLRTDWQIVMRERELAASARVRSPQSVRQQDFERRILELRELRLKREIQDLEYLQVEGEPELQLEYARRLQINTSAINIIRGSLKNMAPQREH